jgi:hypothetical protein
MRRNYVLENETSLGIDFFLWLSEIESDANDSERKVGFQTTTQALSVLVVYI